MQDFLTSVLVIAVSFILGVIDLSVGMGYGFSVTPVLILLGFSVTDTIPAVLAGSLLGGVISSISHQRLGNVDFEFKSKALKMAVLLGVIGAFGVFLGVYSSFSIPERYTQTYIGIITLLSGFFIQHEKQLRFRFTWLRISFMGLIGAVNKGLTGGGYGPVITSGGILSGIKEKTAIAIQSLSESFVSMVGFFYYLCSDTPLQWTLIRDTSLGVMIAAPIAAYFVKSIDEDLINKIIILFSIAMGSLIIMKAWNILIFSG